MTVVVDVPRRDQRYHVTAAESALVGKTQLGPAAVMADRVPSLMSFNSADRSQCDPALVRMGVSHHSLGPVDQH